MPQWATWHAVGIASGGSCACKCARRQLRRRASQCRHASGLRCWSCPRHHGQRAVPCRGGRARPGVRRNCRPHLPTADRHEARDGALLANKSNKLSNTYTPAPRSCIWASAVRLGAFITPARPARTRNGLRASTAAVLGRRFPVPLPCRPCQLLARCHAYVHWPWPWGGRFVCAPRFNFYTP